MHTEDFHQGKNEKHESIDRPEILDRLLSDAKQKELFTKFLNSRVEDTPIIQDINDHHQAKESFTREQSSFLGKRFLEFKQRLALAEKAKKLLSPEVSSHIEGRPDILESLKRQNANAGELINDHLEALAMEDPEALRRMIQIKTELDRKRKAAQAPKYNMEVQGIMSHGAPDPEGGAGGSEEEKMKRFRDATTFAKENHNTSSPEDLKKKIEEHERTIVGRLALSMDRAEMFAALLTPVKLGASAIRDQAGLWKGMLGGIARHLLNASESHGKPTKSEGKKKEEEKKEEESDLTEEEKHYGNPQELHDAFFRLVKKHKYDHADALLKWYLIDKKLVPGDSKKVYDKVSSLMKKKGDGWYKEMEKMLREHLEIDESEDGEEKTGTAH